MRLLVAYTWGFAQTFDFIVKSSLNQQRNLKISEMFSRTRRCAFSAVEPSFIKINSDQAVGSWNEVFNQLPTITQFLYHQLNAFVCCLEAFRYQFCFPILPIRERRLRQELNGFDYSRYLIAIETACCINVCILHTALHKTLMQQVNFSLSPKHCARTLSRENIQTIELIRRKLHAIKVQLNVLRRLNKISQSFLRFKWY